MINEMPFIVEEKRVFSSKGDVIHFLKRSSKGYEGFGEAYFSTIQPNDIKAWKLHKEATCNLTTIKGSVRFVVHTQNQDSFQEFILDEDDEKRLTIPPGLWFGFQNKNSTEAKILNIMDIIHKPEEQISLDINLKEFNWS